MNALLDFLLRPIIEWCCPRWAVYAGVGEPVIGHIPYRR